MAFVVLIFILLYVIVNEKIAYIALGIFLIYFIYSYFVYPLLMK